jgi:hypothetical protein
LEKVPRMPKEISDVVDTASSIITGKRPLFQAPSPASRTAQFGHSEAVEVQMVAYYYAALTNLLCQVCLPPAEQVESNDVIRTIIDASYGDFRMADSWLGALDPKEIRASPSASLYLEIREGWRDQIKDWTTISKKNQSKG